MISIKVVVINIGTDIEAKEAGIEVQERKVQGIKVHLDEVIEKKVHQVIGIETGSWQMTRKYREFDKLNY